MPGGAARVGIAAVAARNALAFDDRFDARHPVVATMLADWERHIVTLTDRLPRRGDLAIPDLNWRLQQGDDPALRSLTGRLPVRNSRDPIGLWFSGIALLADQSSRDIGLRRMRGALDAGLGRLMPIDPALEQSLERFSQ